MSTYTLLIKDATGAVLEIQVSQEVFNEYRRSNWRMEQNDRKHSQSIPFSGLIKGSRDYEEFKELIDPSPDPLDRMIQKEFITTILSTLDDLDKKIFLELFFYGSSERDLARRLRVSEQKINYRKKRLLKNLRKLLDL